MPVVRRERDGGVVGVADLLARRVPVGVVEGLDGEPVLVLVEPMSSTTVRMSVRERPRQLIEMKLNRRCSMRFHFEVPGGWWHTVTARPVSAASRARWNFHARTR